MVDVTPLDDFEHSSRSLKRGVVVSVDEHLARDWERRGLVLVGSKALEPSSRARRAAERAAKGELPAAGGVPPSSALPAAQASRATTAKASKGGAKPKGEA